MFKLIKCITIRSIWPSDISCLSYQWNAPILTSRTNSMGESSTIIYFFLKLWTSNLSVLIKYHNCPLKSWNAWVHLLAICYVVIITYTKALFQAWNHSLAISDVSSRHRKLKSLYALHGTGLTRIPPATQLAKQFSGLRPLTTRASKRSEI